MGDTNGKHNSGIMYEMPSVDYMDEIRPHPCDRKCNGNETARICHYIFVVELHTTLGKVIIIS